MRRTIPHGLAMATILGGGAICAAIGEDAYWWYTGEDRFAETLQVLFFAGALFYVVRARAALGARGEKGFARLYLLTALALFFLVGEEISWGQRIFGWGTPDDFARINRQSETTLHNIEGVHQAVGWALLLIGLYGTVLPFLVRRIGWARALRPQLDLIVPPPRHVPYFLAMLVWRLYRNFFPLPEERAYAIVQINEILELGLAIALCVFFRSVNHALRADSTVVRQR